MLFCTLNTTSHQIQNCILLECLQQYSIKIRVESIKKSPHKLHSLYYKTVTRVPISMCPSLFNMQLLLCSAIQVTGMVHPTSSCCEAIHCFTTRKTLNRSHKQTFYIYTYTHLSSQRQSISPLTKTKTASVHAAQAPLRSLCPMFLLNFGSVSVVSCLQHALTQSQIPVMLSAVLLKMFPSHVLCRALLKLDLPITTFLGCALERKKKD